MTWLRVVASRWVALFRKGRLEKELDQELRVHLEMLIEKNASKGMSSEEARCAARREFGGVEQTKEAYRDRRGWPMIDQLIQDVRYGLRQLRRSPGLTLVITLSLALGIGANTAIFSVINAVMLRLLPVQNPEQLVQVGFQGKHNAQSFVGESFSYPLFQELRRHNQAFTDISAFDYWDSFNAHLSNPGSDAASEPIKGQMVSANFFSLVGVNAVIGRTFAPDEDNGAGAHPVAVISYALWIRMFARDATVLGKRLTIEGRPFSIIGVTPPHFNGVNPGRTCDLWVPITMQPLVAPNEFDLLTSADTNWLSLVARLKPGVSVEQARANLDLVYQQSQRERDISKWSDQDRRDFFTHHIVLLPAARGTDYLRREFSRPLFLLMGMVGLVLLIACANVANLLLARASVRQREIAVRLALGAARRRLIRQLLTESVLLALIGGALGVLFAYWGSPALVVLMAGGGNRVLLDVHPDLSVLGFTLLVAFITGIAFGLAPALRATRTGPNSFVQTGSRNLTASRSGRNLGRALVIAQVALSLVLVIGAGLLIRTLRNLETLDPGFSRQNVLLFGLDPTRAGYKEERLVRLYQQVLERVRQMPGVRSASFSFLTPISGGGWDNYTYIEGYTPGPGESMDVYINAVGPRFFETLGTPLLLGRDFGPQDRAGSTWVGVINQAMSHRFFGDRNPIGRHFWWGWNDNRRYEIIGVVGDAKYLGLREEVPPTAYLYLPQDPKNLGGITFEISGAIPAVGLVPQVRSLLQTIDSRLAASDVKTLAEQVDQSLYQERLVSTLSTFFGVLALLLACVGLYGVMSYAVARRTSEIGIRMALGAESNRILRMILREALFLAVAGIAIGLPVEWAANHAIAGMLYGLKPTDPITVVVCTLLMAGVAALAGYLPARRASRVDPMVSLRYE